MGETLPTVQKASLQTPMTVLPSTCMEGKHIPVGLDYALLVWEMMPRLTDVSNGGTRESGPLALRFGDVYNPLSIFIAQMRG